MTPHAGRSAARTRRHGRHLFRRRRRRRLVPSSPPYRLQRQQSTPTSAHHLPPRQFAPPLSSSRLFPALTCTPTFRIDDPSPSLPFTRNAPFLSPTCWRSCLSALAPLCLHYTLPHTPKSTPCMPPSPSSAACPQVVGTTGRPKRRTWPMRPNTKVHTAAVTGCDGRSPEVPDRPWLSWLNRTCADSYKVTSGRCTRTLRRRLCRGFGSV